MRERDLRIREGGMAADRGDTANPREDVFASLIDANLTRAYRLAVVLLGGTAEAEDAVQDAAVAAWRSFASLREMDRFEAWFDRIIVNQCRDRLRTRGRVRVISIDDSDAAETDRSARIGEQQEVTAALRKLPIHQREVVALRFFADLSIDEIAARTGERSGTVKSRLHYGLAGLRAAYDAARRSEEL
jgi:RNA polymerase sigma-70 factor, ECF subfamily